MKTVLYTRAALRSLPAHSNRAKQISARIEQYATNPAALTNNFIQLTGSSAKRFRVAGFHVVFNEVETTITILALGPWGEIYDQERHMPVMTKTPLGDDIVILSRAEYDALISGRRDEDTADAARANDILADIARGTETLLTSEQASQLLEARTPLAFWRKHRGVTQEALSKSVGVAQGFISEIENGTKTGDVQTLAAMARALEVSLNDLVIPKPIKSKGWTKNRKIRATSSTGGRRGRPYATRRKVKSASVQLFVLTRFLDAKRSPPRIKSGAGFRSKTPWLQCVLDPYQHCRVRRIHA